MANNNIKELSLSDAMIKHIFNETDKGTIVSIRDSNNDSWTEGYDEGVYTGDTEDYNGDNLVECVFDETGNFAKLTKIHSYKDIFAVPLKYTGMAIIDGKDPHLRKGYIEQIKSGNPKAFSSGGRGYIILPPKLKALPGGVFSGFTIENTLLQIPPSVETVAANAFKGARISDKYGRFDILLYDNPKLKLSWNAFDGMIPYETTYGQYYTLWFTSSAENLVAALKRDTGNNIDSDSTDQQVFNDFGEYLKDQGFNSTSPIAIYTTDSLLDDVVKQSPPYHAYS